MKTLQTPLLNTTVEEIFHKCVEGYTDEKRKNRLLGYTYIIERDTLLYEKKVPDQIHEFSPSRLPDDDASEELRKVYTEKFARKNSPGRKYYNEILSQTPNGVCPICGIRAVSTLDHYLPKSKIPTLSVTPSNLIPSCRDCNMDKQERMKLEPQKTPVHLYFDNIPADPWLYVEVGDKMEITYFIECLPEWDAGLCCRLQNHLDTYKLGRVYSSHAAQIITENSRKWRRLLCVGGKQELRRDIAFTLDSLENVDRNSWKTALYRGLYKEIDMLVNWLNDVAVD